MSHRYPFPWGYALRVFADAVLKRRRSFCADSRRLIAMLDSPLRVFGSENVPSCGPCLLTPNHYRSETFRSWWLTLGISSQVPVEVHWIMSEAWTYPDRLRSMTFTPVTRWTYRRVARAYGFTYMPPMPPRPWEVEARAKAVRRVLTHVRKTRDPIVGLAPEGRDPVGAPLVWPPPGAGRFVMHLTRAGLAIVPIGVWEDEIGFWMRFGPAYRLPGFSAHAHPDPDRAASEFVMRKIAEQLPEEMRGEFG